MTPETKVFAALEQRKTIREISPAALPLPQLSTLPWAAFGVNRKTGPFGLAGLQDPDGQKAY